MPRKSSTGTTNFFDMSCNSTATTHSCSSKTIAKGKVIDRLHNNEICIRYQSALESDCSQEEQRDKFDRKSRNKSVTRNGLTCRRHTMDHSYQITNESTTPESFRSAHSSAAFSLDDAGTFRSDNDGSSHRRRRRVGIFGRLFVSSSNIGNRNGNTQSIGSVSRRGSRSTISRLSEDGELYEGLSEELHGDLMSSPKSHPESTSCMQFTSLPTQKFPSKSQRRKHERRSSLSKAASSVKSTLEASRNWLSASFTSSSNVTTPPIFQEQIETSRDVRDDVHLLAKLQSQFSSELTRLKTLATTMHREGRFDQAITHWTKALDLAEMNRDLSSLSDVSEILCMLFDLHFQENQRLRQEEDAAEDKSQMPLSKDDESSTGNISECSLRLEDVLNEQFPIEEQNRGRDSASNDNERTAAVTPAVRHQRQAEQYVHRIKPVMVQPQWLRCDHSLMEFLCEAKAWELALIVAKNLSEQSSSDKGIGEEVLEPGEDNCLEESSIDVNAGSGKFATIHFHIAAMKLKSRKQGEAVQHLQLTIQRLEEVPADQRDMTMYLEALHLLATEYQQQGKHNLALKTYQQEQSYASQEKAAQISSHIAEIYIADGQLDMALEELESAYSQHDKSRNANDDSNCEKSVTKHAIRAQLLQLKGDVYYHLGRREESLQVYQQAFQEAQNPAERAKLLYTTGKLCSRMGRTRDAISCFMHELEITQNELGAHHLSVSVIYHQLAKLYDEGLGWHKMALKKYKNALEIELAVMDDIHSTVASCSECDAAYVHRMCDEHANIFSQVQGQISETKKCMGRMHFKLGDFDGAMKTGLTGNDDQP